MLIPSRSQWNNWSLLERLTAIGVYAAIFSLIFGAIPLFSLYSNDSDVNKNSIVGEWYLHSIKSEKGETIIIDKKVANSMRFRRDFKFVNINEPFFVFDKNGKFSTQAATSLTIGVDGSYNARYGEAAMQSSTIYYSTDGYRIIFQAYERADGKNSKNKVLDYKISNDMLYLYGVGSDAFGLKEIALTRKKRETIDIRPQYLSKREIIEKLSGKTVEFNGKLYYFSQNNVIKSEASLNDLGEKFTFKAGINHFGNGDIDLSSGDGLWYASEDSVYIAIDIATQPFVSSLPSTNIKVHTEGYYLFSGSSGKIIMCFMGAEPSEDCQPGYIMTIRDGDVHKFAEDIAIPSKEMIESLGLYNKLAEVNKNFQYLYELAMYLVAKEKKNDKDYNNIQELLKIPTKNGHQKAACELISLYSRNGGSDSKGRLKWVKSQDQNKIEKWIKIARAVSRDCGAPK